MNIKEVINGLLDLGFIYSDKHPIEDFANTLLSPNETFEIEVFPTSINIFMKNSERSASSMDLAVKTKKEVFDVVKHLLCADVMTV